jgi:hypothetical protein
MMIAVALVGVFLGLLAWDLRLQELSRAYRKQAYRVSRFEETKRLSEANLRKWSEGDRAVASATEEAMLTFEAAGVQKKELRVEVDFLRRRASKQREEADRVRALAEHYGSLRRKWERAARYPWRAVEPDPPDPE